MDTTVDSRPTIIVADDHQVVGAAIATSLQKWFRVVATVATLDDLEVAIRRESPAAVLLDLSFGDDSSLRLLPDLVRAHPDTRFVVLTAHAEPVLVDAALRGGAIGFVVKQSAPSEVRVALEEALEGRVYVTPTLRPRRAGDPIVEPVLEAPQEIELTDRQRQIIGLARAGLSFREIGDRLSLTPKTVEYHLDAIRARLGLSRTAQVVRWAERNGIGDPG